MQIYIYIMLLLGCIGMTPRKVIRSKHCDCQCLLFSWANVSKANPLPNLKTSLLKGDYNPMSAAQKLAVGRGP